MNLKDKVKNLPSSPGVYLMKDSLGMIIYVGKAKVLKRRVQSYFQNSRAHPQKIVKLVKNIKDFEYLLTDTEFEAFMLECKLIKEYKPLFNKMMKNLLTYTYIVIGMDTEIRSIGITHNPIENDGNLYFGPFTSKHTVERAIQAIKECYKIDCSNPSKKKTACLNYSLGLCIGICLGGSAIEQYNTIIDKIIALLNGTDMSILEEMKQKMLDASEKFDFITAAKYRDDIDLINFLLNKEKIIEFTEDNKNIAMMEYLNNSTIKLFLIKGNQVLLSEKYLLEGTDIYQLRAMVKKNILAYFKGPSTTLKVCRDDIDEAQIIYNYLKSSSCSYIIIPENWLHTENNSDLEGAINKLLSIQNKV